MSTAKPPAIETKPYIDEPTEMEEDITPYIRTPEQREAVIKEYEAMFNMTSEAFLKQIEAGYIPDSFEERYWAVLLHYR